MKLVRNWKRCLRWWSVRGLALIAALPPIWISLPRDVKAMIPPDAEIWIVSVIAVGTIAARLKDQGEDA